MKAAVFAMLLLLGSGAVHGRRMLLQDSRCADFSALDAVPDVSDIVTVIKGFGLLPNGIPSNVTVFLPSNAAVADLIGLVTAILPGVTPENLPELVAGLPASLNVPGRLVSALLYHVVPLGALTPEELLAEGELPTALEGYSLKFEESSVGNYTVTTAIGDVATALGPATACGSSVFIVDKVLTPAQLLDPAFPITSLEDAIAILGGEPAAAAPTPTP